MFKEFKHIKDGAIPGKPVSVTLNPYGLKHSKNQWALESFNLIKKGQAEISKGEHAQMREKKR